MLTDPQIIEAVLTSCGWWQDGLYDLWHSSHERDKGEHWADEDAAKILTSLDACHEVFEKDASSLYWDEVRNVYSEQKGGLDYAEEEYEASGRATPRQRCEAWLRFKGVESK